MLIYLDANVVQYCADYEAFVFGDIQECPTSSPKLKKELLALRRLVDLEQLGDWSFAVSPQLLTELLAGRPRAHQTRAYQVLLEAWRDSG